MSGIHCRILTCLGQPVRDPSVSTTLPFFGGGGLTTLGDTLLLETLAHFSRERIPERYVRHSITHDLPSNE